MRKLLLSIPLSLILFSCENEHNLIIKKSDVPLIVKVIAGGTPYYEYSYNKSYLVSEEKSRFIYTKHNYNDKNQLTSSDYYYDLGMLSCSSSIFHASMSIKNWVSPDNSEISLTRKYEYENNGKLVRVRLNRPSVITPEYSELTIENDRITRQETYYEDVLITYIDYFYDQKGNLIKAEEYHLTSAGVSERWTTNEYKHDDMKNPYQSFSGLMIPGKFTNPNNITEHIYTIHFDVDQWTQKETTTRNSYIYNDLGYPVSVNGETEYIYSW